MWYEKTKTGKYKYIERYTDPLTNKEIKISVTLDKKNDKKAHDILNTRIKERTTQMSMYRGKNATLQFIYKHKRMLE